MVLHKNGMRAQEVSCLRVEHLENAILEVKERPLTNQLLLEYFEQESA
jgi:hypothetical protein